jgi:transposase
MTRISVGIDVSKGKSTVSAFSWDEKILIKPHDVPHTSDSLKKLATELKQLDGEVRIILEHTGRYWLPVAQALHSENLFVTAVNPKLIKDFGNIAFPIEIYYCLYGLFAFILSFKNPYITMVMRGF